MNHAEPLIFSRIDFRDLSDKIEQLGEKHSGESIEQIRRILRRAYSEKPFFFAGVSTNGFLSGLLYILTGHSQDSVSSVFGCSQVTVRKNYKKWINSFSWLLVKQMYPNRPHTLGGNRVRCVECKYLPKEFSGTKMSDLDFKEIKNVEVSYEKWAKMGELLDEYSVVIQRWPHEKLFFWKCPVSGRIIRLLCSIFLWRKCDFFEPHNFSGEGGGLEL